MGERKCDKHATREEHAVAVAECVREERAPGLGAPARARTQAARLTVRHFRGRVNQVLVQVQVQGVRRVHLADLRVVGGRKEWSGLGSVKQRVSAGSTNAGAARVDRPPPARGVRCVGPVRGGASAPSRASVHECVENTRRSLTFGPSATRQNSLGRATESSRCIMPCPSTSRVRQGLEGQHQRTARGANNRMRPTHARARWQSRRQASSRVMPLGPAGAAQSMRSTHFSPLARASTGSYVIFTLFTYGAICAHRTILRSLMAAAGAPPGNCSRSDDFGS